MATKKTSRKRSATDKDADAIDTAVMTCAPLFDRDTMYSIERNFSSGRTGRNRRVILGVAIQDGEFFKRLTTDRETAVLMASVVELARDEAQKLKALLDVYEAVRIRIAVAL